MQLIYRIIIFLFLFFPDFLQAQDIEYANRIIKELASDKYHGRGYVRHGEHKAAMFVAKEFSVQHLTPFDHSSFQTFTFPVNTLPSVAKLEVGSRWLNPGSDYIILPNSCSLQGKYTISILDNKIVSDSAGLKAFFNQDFRHRILGVDTTGINNKELSKELTLVADQNIVGAAAVVEFTKGNLSSSVSMKTSTYVSVKMHRDCLSPTDSIISLRVKNKFYPSYQTQNIACYIKGQIDSFIVFTAHYDHLGMMGKRAFFPGANDNASGTAFVLDMARNYSSQTGKRKYSVAFILFGAEEAGLIGSKYFTEHPLFPLSKIKLLMNFDMVGTGEEGITVVNGTIQRKAYNSIDSINKVNHFLKEVAIRGPAMNSDHYWFNETGVPSVFIYTRGSDTHYHSIGDKVETLSLAKYNELFKLITLFVDGL